MLTTTLRELSACNLHPSVYRKVRSLLDASNTTTEQSLQGDTLLTAIGAAPMLEWMVVCPRTRVKTVRFLVEVALCIDERAKTPTYLQFVSRAKETLDKDPDAHTVDTLSWPRGNPVPIHLKKHYWRFWAGEALENLATVLSPTAPDVFKGRAAGYLATALCVTGSRFPPSNLVRALLDLMQTMD